MVLNAAESSKPLSVTRINELKVEDWTGR